LREIRGGDRGPAGATNAIAGTEVAEPNPGWRLIQAQNRGSFTHALLIGLGPLAEPSASVAAVLRSDLELDARLKVDFEVTLCGVFETRIAAWSAQPATAVLQAAPRRTRKERA